MYDPDGSTSGTYTTEDPTLTAAGVVATQTATGVNNPHRSDQAVQLQRDVETLTAENSDLKRAYADAQAIIADLRTQLAVTLEPAPGEYREVTPTNPNFHGDVDYDPPPSTINYPASGNRPLL